MMDSILNIWHDRETRKVLKNFWVDLLPLRLLYFFGALDTPFCVSEVEDHKKPSSWFGVYYFLLRRVSYFGARWKLLLGIL